MVAMRPKTRLSRKSKPRCKKFAGWHAQNRLPALLSVLQRHLQPASVLLHPLLGPAAPPRLPSRARPRRALGRELSCAIPPKPPWCLTPPERRPCSTCPLNLLLRTRRSGTAQRAPPAAGTPAHVAHCLLSYRLGVAKTSNRRGRSQHSPPSPLCSTATLTL